MTKRFRTVVLIGLVASFALVPALVSGQQGDHDFGHPEFLEVWERTDRPVQDGHTQRTWIWGPGATTPILQEQYLEAPGGERDVQYTDKSRMEWPVDESASADSEWFITQGLLATELMTGRLQLGHDSFEDFQPANIPVAGDPDDTFGPTYAVMGSLMDHGARPVGSTITQVLTSDGTIFDNNDLAVHGVTDAHYVEQTGHNVASVFWEFMNSSGTVYENGEFQQGPVFQNPFYGVGFPRTEAYWGWVKVDNVEQNVLIQCFERRCLTYAPDNPEGWQVESGNIGQHYYNWRYNIISEPVDPPVGEPSFSVTPPAATSQVGATHELTVTVVDGDDNPLNGAEVTGVVTSTTGATQAHLGTEMTGTSGDDGDGIAVLSYTGVENGQDTITVTVDGISGEEVVTQTWADLQLVLEPSSQSLAPGETREVVATVEDNQGQQVPITSSNSVSLQLVRDTTGPTPVNATIEIENGSAVISYQGPPSPANDSLIISVQVDGISVSASATTSWSEILVTVIPSGVSKPFYGEDENLLWAEYVIIVNAAVENNITELDLTNLLEAFGEANDYEDADYEAILTQLLTDSNDVETLLDAVANHDLRTHSFYVSVQIPGYIDADEIDIHVVDDDDNTIHEENGVSVQSNGMAVVSDYVYQATTAGTDSIAVLIDDEVVATYDDLIEWYEHDMSNTDAILTLDPFEGGPSDVGESHTVTGTMATSDDPNAPGISGAVVIIEIESGPNEGNPFGGVTDSTGSITYEYVGDGGEGVDVFSAFGLFLNANNEIKQVDDANATMVWE